MKKVFEYLSMQKKLTVLFFVCTLIPMVVILAFSITSLYDDEIIEYNISTVEKLNGAVNVMNRYIDQDIMKSEAIVKSSLVVDGLQKNYENDIMSLMVYYKDLDELMSGFGNYGDAKCCIYPVVGYFPLGKHIGDIETLENNKEIWKQLNNESNAIIVWDYSNVQNENNTGYISLYRKINDFEKLLGFFETRIYIKDLIYPLENLSINKGERISCIIPTGVNIYLSEEPDEKKFDIENQVELNGGSVVKSSINKGVILENYYMYIAFLLIGFFVILASLFLLYKRMITLITKDLTDFIKILQTNSELTTDDLKDGDSADSGIALIKYRFCELLLKTKKMYSDIAKMTRVRSVMELELLQTGINPHLLYNSLGVVRWQLMRTKQYDFVEMIDNMSQYYRYVLAGGDYIITIAEEIELTDKYIKINELAYKNKYTVIKEIDSEVLDLPVIKLILQPIVENAILHGLVDKDDGIISIKIEKKEGNIIFTIKDNGHGMTQDNIKDALDIKKVQRRKGGYGISNTIKRIKTYYGEECGIDIISDINVGTTVIINIKNIGRDELRSKFDEGC